MKAPEHMTLEEARLEIERLHAAVQRRDEQILKLSTAILPISEPAENLVAELMAAVRQTPASARTLTPPPVPTCTLTPMEIRAADAAGRMVVDADGYGIVYPAREAVAPANPHPSGCHTEAPGTRDCDSDGHESCLTCSRRTERDEKWWREGGIVEPPQGGRSFKS